MTRRGLWWASVGAIVLVSVRIWHLLLLPGPTDVPGRLPVWIVLAWVLAGLGLLAERWARDGAGVPRLWRRLGTEAWVVLALSSALLLLFDVDYVRAVGDGRGYFAQLHSLVFDLDLDFANDIAAFGARPADAAFPIGTALFWAPFYLLAHLWLGLLNVFGAEHARDGFWNPYQRAVGVATLVYGVAAVLLIATEVRRRFDRSTTLAAVGAVLLATPVVWYVAVDASMSHGVSLFAATVFLVLWLRIRDRRTAAHWVGLAAAAALMIAVRPQNLLFVAVLPVEWAAGLAASWRAGDRARVRRALRAGAALALAGLAVLAIVLLTSADLAYAYRQRLLSEWSVGQQLFSPHHGLLSSSPVLVFALLGLIPLARRDRTLAIAIAAVVALQVLAGGTSPGWNAGASFGARRFVACALPFALGLAAAVEWARRRPMVPVALLLAGLVVINLSLLDAARTGDLTLSDPVPFTRMAGEVGERVGNPFVLPAALVFAWRHQVPIAFYDQIPSRKYERLAVDVGGPDDESWLIGAWFDREQGPAGTFRWASGPEAGIFTQVRRDRYLLRFTAQPFEWAGSPQQAVEVYLGRQRLAEIPMESGARTYEVEIPTERMPAHDWMRITFRFHRSTQPREVIDAQDARPLAALFHTIELEPY